MGDAAHRKVIARYSEREHINHWILAIAFVLTALSGLALFHPSMYWMSSLVGGGTWSRILHPFIGLVMTVSFVLLALAVGQAQPDGRARLEVAARDAEGDVARRPAAARGRALQRRPEDPSRCCWPAWPCCCCRAS